MTPPATTFQDTFRSIDDVEGWMTEGQARRLWERASALKEGQQVVEIGSYHGRSAIVLATSAPEGVTVVAIDPHAGNDRGPQQIEGPAEEGQRDHETFMANLERAGVRDQVTHLRIPSQQAGAAVEGDIDLLYIDGAHRYIPARDDIRDYGARVADGGTMLIHDSFSSVGVTLALMTQLFWSGEYRYVGRESSMSEYRRDSLRGVQKVRNLLRQAAELPWFVRNVIIKVLIVAKLGRFTRFLGHREANWPY
jgi:predicted O-methyltransferase YrrM